MRFDARLIFRSRSAIKCFKMPVGCPFQETLLCGTLPISHWPRSHQLRSGANPSGYTLTVDGLQVFQYSLFPAWVTSRTSRAFGEARSLLCCLQDGTLQRVRTILSLSFAYGKGLRHVSQYWVCRFVLGILVRIICSATPVLFTCLRCILHVRLCCGALCVTCSLVRVQNTLFCLRTLLSLKLCLCDGWGKYLCILYCHRGFTYGEEYSRTSIAHFLSCNLVVSLQNTC